MKCDSCGKEKMWLHFIGKDNICNRCIARHTVFKEVKNSEETMLRKTLQVLNITCFQDLKQVTNAQVDEIAMGAIKSAPKPVVKFKKNALPVDDEADPMTEHDQFW